MTEQKIEIKTVREAINYALEIIGKYERIIRFEKSYGEKGLRGVLIYTEKNTYSVRFKNKLYGSFSYKDEEGGERIRTKGLAEDKGNLYVCKGNNFTPLMVLNDGRIYTYPADKWIDWCEKRAYDTNVIKSSKQREEVVDNWVYYNIPLPLMTNYEKMVRK